MNDVFKRAFMCRGGYRATATSKMEHFVIIVNDFQLLTIITKCIVKKPLKILKAILGVFNTVKNKIKSKLKTDGKN